MVDRRRRGRGRHLRARRRRRPHRVHAHQDSGWTVAIGIPTTSVESGTWRSVDRLRRRHRAVGACWAASRRWRSRAASTGRSADAAARRAGAGPRRAAARCRHRHPRDPGGGRRAGRLGRAAPARRSRARAAAGRRAGGARRRRAGAPPPRAAGLGRRGAVALAASRTRRCEAIASILVPRLADWCRVDLVDADGALQRALDPPLRSRRSRASAPSWCSACAPRPTRPARWPGRSRTGQPHSRTSIRPRTSTPTRDRDLLTFAQRDRHARVLRSCRSSRAAARWARWPRCRPSRDRSFSADDCALLVEIAQRAALALDNARLYADARVGAQQAERANRAKDEFLAMLGHELRNPLAPIVTALHLMALRGGDEAATRARASSSARSAHLLAPGRRPARRLAHRPRQDPARARACRPDARCVARARRAHAAGARAARAAIDVRAAAEPPVFVAGDAVRLAQVLSPTC